MAIEDKITNPLVFPTNDRSTIAWFGLTRVELAGRLRRLADDLERGRPSPTEPGHAAVQKWELASRTVPCIVGISSGHPTVSDGAPLFSSELFFIDDKQRSARSFSRWYELRDRAEPGFWSHMYGRQQ